ncbi:MAG: polysaccharide biosynthesis/export family protein [Alphaproteobacteria bacterium]|nr:polysaccharide biosynthesis/export family protein [Alphaproteobacteria bacterium]MDE1985292.1 polysaccharide biosynthesis/export family protein [Alphaproteobacteria bacterium]MDE2164456.1 polysaccharide biosynthesis/export family protein [Alphaproteobacteria bacterium]MDE2265343.1 polysaccharide biosynthesis/export family protein [Alphaproteobacteria bacterium]MDE2498609.1 polysaccharide biosynthesis/export family protein [Alphaproteobacteria bacterium]
MVRTSAISALAAALAMLASAYAQSTGTPPATEYNPQQNIPRYAAEIPPGPDDSLTNQNTVPPVAAPTTPVTVSQAPQPRYAAQIPPSSDDARLDAPPPTNAPQTNNTSPPQSRYAAMIAPPADESVTVNGLRPSEDGGYRLGTGDTVRVTVFGETDLSGEFQIDSTGYVQLPLIGRVAAAGLSTYGLESHIASALTGGGYLLNPRVSVQVTTYRPFYIIGEVNKPGEYPYVNAMSVPNAIAMAGGFTDRAVESEVIVRHQGQTKGEEVPADQSASIRPGDVVRVERTTYWSIMTLLSPIISPFSTVAYLLK